MITSEKLKKGVDLINQVVKKTIESPTYKKELLDNPHLAIESLYGKTISKEMNIVVEEQSNPNYIYFNIPVKPNINEVELTDEQLELVSGGEFILAGAAIIIGSGLVGAASAYAICYLLD
ncbi:putative ribosomally synthesized peptide [Flavobacterium tiangeerense]|uniref:Ribosomally synthesized peptide n=1 Tax=Flavobacterium tiangeerense TaxID=459471 RepID=A0ABY3FN29_9FLAO|nr:NHLP leader peptide family RiPP precursor [Flavobacterium tiangeerense]TWI03216.1 putative ribosomally synthesized peptide [Flavobacterium tiangeerense]